MEPDTPQGRLLQRCMDHARRARMPPNPALLDGSVTAVRLRKAGKALTKGGAWKSLLRQQGTVETSRGAGQCTSGNSAEGRQPAGVLASPRWPRLPPLLARGALPCALRGGEGGQPACEGRGGHRLALPPQLRRGERALSELPSPGPPGGYLPQRGMLRAGEGEPSCLLRGQRSLRSCCGWGGRRPPRSRLPRSVGGRGGFGPQALPSVGPAAR